MEVITLKVIALVSIMAIGLVLSGLGMMAGLAVWL